MPKPPVPYDVILNSLSDGVYVCDRNRRITYWNTSAERITGWSPEDVLGRTCAEDILAHVDTETTLPISPGDAFLFVTDGAFEIDNAHREQLGIEGLMAVLEQLGYPATPLDMHRLEERLLLFSNEIRLPDDLTILEIGFRNDARAPSG